MIGSNCPDASLCALGVRLFKRPRRPFAPMKPEPSLPERTVTVKTVPIELCQFLKFGGLAESGGAAKQAIAAGLVLVNGRVENQKGKKLTAGDRVTFEGHTIVLQSS